MRVRNGIRFVECTWNDGWVQIVCPYMHNQYSLFHLSSFSPLRWVPSILKCHICSSAVPHNFQRVYVCVRERACVCLSVSPLNMHSWSQGSFFFFWKTRMTACSGVLPRPHRDVPFHVLTLPGPAACWRKSPEESAQIFLGWCCVLKRIMINVIWHRRVL